jgi:hypothetical protein
MNRLCTEQNKMAINNTLGVWVGGERALVYLLIKNGN